MIPARVRESAARCRRDGERGVIAVEAAFAIPIMVLLAVGILAFGQAYGDASITSGASRSGARLASSSYAGATDKNAAAASVLASVTADLANLRGATPVEVWMYQTLANGDPPSGNYTTCSGNCIKWTYNSTNGTWGSSSGSWSNPDGCGATTDYVGVFVKTDVKLNTGMFGSRTITVKQKTSMRIEPILSTLCP